MTTTVLVGEFAHETNTFVPDVTDRVDFRDRREYLGEEVPVNMAGTETSIGGVIDAVDEYDIDLIHTVSTFATPGGVVTDDAYDHYTSIILDAVRSHEEDLDGVILTLHGAMVTESRTDGEGPLIDNVRSIVGEATPIVVTLDLHANVSQQMVESADALVSYETYPHLDKADTGREGLDLLDRTIRGEVDPTSHIERPPTIIFQPKAHTSRGPMPAVMERARELEDNESILKVNVLPGFYHADIPEMGVTVPVVSDGDPDLAKKVSREVADLIWNRRNEFVANYPTPQEAVTRAKDLVDSKSETQGPVVMADFGSNPGGGGASNGTTIIREFLDQGVENAGWAIMYDPEAVSDCLDAGVGNRLRIDIGGKTDDQHGETITDLDGYVKALTDGKYVNTGTSHSGKGVQNSIGRTVRFQSGENDSLTIVLAERRSSAFDAEIWRHVGVQPERLDVICIPSLIAFLGDYEPLSSDVILVDTPGWSAVNPERFDYSRIPRPVYPLDSDQEIDYPYWTS